MSIVTRTNSPDGIHENNVPVDFHEVITRFRDKEVVKEIREDDAYYIILENPEDSYITTVGIFRII